MPHLDPNIMTIPVDSSINGDAYMPGLSNPVTADEVTDIYSESRVPLQDRIDALQKLRREMVSRASADTMDDTQSLIAKIDEGLSYLNEKGDGYADPDVLRHRDTAAYPSNI